MRALALLFAFVVVSPSWAARAEEPRSRGLSVSVKGQYSYLGLLRSGATFSYGSWLAGANLDWCFVPHLCAYLGGEALERGYDSGAGPKAPASYADTTLGFLWRQRGDLISESSLNNARFAFFYAVPLTRQLSVVAPQRDLAHFFGFSFSGESIYPINGNFGLGFSLTGKIGFDAVVKTVKVPAVGLYAGLVAYFF